MFMPRLQPSRICLLLSALAVCVPAYAQQPFLATADWNLLRDSTTGTAPYENLRFLTGLHRVPATDAFDQAADFVLRKATEYGLNDAHAERFEIDGQTHYGLMRSYFGWKVQSASLWQTGPEPNLIADWSADPIRLADYSRSADVSAQLIDVGDGTKNADYTGKEVRGKIVLADGVLAEVQALAVIKLGAAGIVSDMRNQSTAWSGLDPTLIRWGHLDARQPGGFAFMVSKATATALRAQMTAGHPVTLHAQIQAEVGPGHWTVVTATIPGDNPRAGEIVYSCHLDHERPGANDNGSGCVTILESARVLHRLISEGRLPRPARTLRFIWSPEIEGTMAFLAMHPEIRSAMHADVHMDMVGGDPFKNKSILHVTETPWSLPSYVTDVGAAIADAIRAGASAYTEDGSDAAAAVLEDRNGAPGTRNAFFVDQTPYEEGSDHDVYDSSTLAIPSLYLRDWPDIYIHTDHDSLSQIDATKLRRVALLGAASGYTYAALRSAQVPALLPFFAARSQQRLAKSFEGAQGLLRNGTIAPTDAGFEAHNLIAQALQRESAMLRNFVSEANGNPGSVAKPIEALKSQAAILDEWLDATASQLGLEDTRGTPRWRSQPIALRIPHRIGEFGPLSYQNDDVLQARLGAARVAKIQLLSGDSSRLLNAQGTGAIFAYEILNFVDGKRTVADIRDAVSAEFFPLPLATVADYLQACEEAKVITYHCDQACNAGELRVKIGVHQ
jgi:aminopeptidase YwaD